MLFSLFIITFLVSFLGALPFGVVNLTTTKITMEESKSSALKFILGASLVELVHAAFALWFAEAIVMHIIENPYVKFSIGALLISIGAYLCIRKENPTIENKNKGRKNLPKFILGMFLSLINPQALPFWIFAITYINTHKHVIISSTEIATFIVGVFIGKILALLLFVYGSYLISSKLKLCCNIISKVMGSILILGGIIHYIKAYL